MMQKRATAFFAANPGLSFAALGAARNSASLDLTPFGQAARYFAAEQSHGLIDRYRAANHLAFPGPLSLPGWVLSDLYLLPGAIGLLLGPAGLLPELTRAALALRPSDESVIAAYLAVPSITPGLFIGISLFSLLPNRSAGAWVKALTLKLYRARHLRGVAQWSSPSICVHTRMGPLRLIGPVSAAHELGKQSFVYECALDDEARWAVAMDRQFPMAATQRIPGSDIPSLATLLARAEAGDEIYLAPPGLDTTGAILIHARPFGDGLQSRHS